MAIMKTILITGATDGIGLETARMLLEQGHHVLMHGRNRQKLQKVIAELSDLGKVDCYMADLSDFNQVEQLANSIIQNHQTLDVLINNAGVLKVSEPQTEEGLDIRFVVNTLSPYLLTKKLLPILGQSGRVINLSSAAQAPVNIDALSGNVSKLDDMEAYSQSKLAITMWSYSMSMSLGIQGPVIVAVNPGSLLGSKMVRDGFGIAGKSLSIGAKILVNAALSDEFSTSSGKYFDNDLECFSKPHQDVFNEAKVAQVMKTIESSIEKYS